MRLYLEYQDGSVQLPAGETTIGRDVDCSLRFNDPFVSRRHVRVLFGDAGVFVEEVASRNGTLLNEVQLEGRQPLKHGDTLSLGRRTLKVLIVEEEPTDESQVTTQPDVEDLLAGPVELEAALRARRQAPPTSPAPPPDRTCPRCRTDVPAALDRCEECGHEFRRGRPAATTQKLELAEVHAQMGELDRRDETRRNLDLPVLYTSEMMTIDATTNDLSRSGVFIASALLDEVGTPCQVTLLPEAAPAIPIDSVVARVVADGEAGMGVRFETLSHSARHWLEAILDRAGTGGQ